jgi:hypothetical protein
VLHTLLPLAPTPNACVPLDDACIVLFSVIHTALAQWYYGSQHYCCINNLWETSEFIPVNFLTQLSALNSLSISLLFHSLFQRATSARHYWERREPAACLGSVLARNTLHNSNQHFKLSHIIKSANWNYYDLDPGRNSKFNKSNNDSFPKVDGFRALFSVSAENSSEKRKNHQIKLDKPQQIPCSIYFYNFQWLLSQFARSVWSSRVNCELISVVVSSSS